LQEIVWLNLTHLITVHNQHGPLAFA